MDAQSALKGSQKFCPECQEQGLKSRVNAPGGAFVTAMMHHEYYDEEGRHHFHDPNTRTSEWSCSEGHTWTESYRPKCWCGHEGI